MVNEACGGSIQHPPTCTKSNTCPTNTRRKNEGSSKSSVYVTKENVLAKFHKGANMKKSSDFAMSFSFVPQTEPFLMSPLWPNFAISFSFMLQTELFEHDIAHSNFAMSFSFVPQTELFVRSLAWPNFTMSFSFVPQTELFEHDEILQSHQHIKISPSFQTEESALLTWPTQIWPCCIPPTPHTRLIH